MEKCLDAADKEILTPRGPNGSLRSIDKKRKKVAKDNSKNESKSIRNKNVIKVTESQSKKIIFETIKNIL